MQSAQVVSVPHILPTGLKGFNIGESNLFCKTFCLGCVDGINQSTGFVLSVYSCVGISSGYFTFWV